MKKFSFVGLEKSEKQLTGNSILIAFWHAGITERGFPAKPLSELICFSRFPMNQHREKTEP